MPTFGERFKTLRLLKNYTQEGLVQDFNKQYHYTLTKSAISQYENGKRIPEVNVLIDFAAYFKVSIDYLLCRDTATNSLVEEQANLYKIPEKKKQLELAKLPNELNRIIDENFQITFQGKPLSNKAIEFIKMSIEIGVELSKKNSYD